MRCQGVCRHNASSGGNASRQGAMRRQGMCRHNASSVRGQCVVRECVVTVRRQGATRRGRGQCVVRECVVTMRRP